MCVMKDRIEHKEWLFAAKDQPCVRCGVTDGTVCARHYEGLRQHHFGKGKGIKGHDIFIADLCLKCDDDLSNQKPNKNDSHAVVEHSEMFLFYVCKTIERRYRQGFIRG